MSLSHVCLDQADHRGGGAGACGRRAAHCGGPLTEATSNYIFDCVVCAGLALTYATATFELRQRGLRAHVELCLYVCHFGVGNDVVCVDDFMLVQHKRYSCTVTHHQTSLCQLSAKDMHWHHT